ncbi:MAG: 5'/3'-nucleotidase SurE [Candidatus Omnitrophica bacterium]|nr:5'/3'-nucleotidase SurE [Candidatus Omnitrophota bacterium]
MKKHIKILLTNDDGIGADGILALYKELTKFASVIVVAPDSQRSSVGHGITLSRPIWVKKTKKDAGIKGHAITGTPADCIKFALEVVLKKKPDLIISGINLGPNEGCSVFYSGTVAAAREGALCGVASMAVSLNTFVDPDFSYAAKIAGRIAKKILDQSLPRGTFLNLNVPNLPKNKIKGIKLTSQGKIPIKAKFVSRKDPSDLQYYWMSGEIPKTERKETVDTVALNQGYVCITPIESDSTDYKVLSSLENWNLA